MDCFIVMAESGEYEQRSEWIVGVFSTRELADAALNKRRASAQAYQTAWDGWCKIGGSRSGVPHPECLTPGECTGDRFTIIQTTVDTASDVSANYPD